MARISDLRFRYRVYLRSYKYRQIPWTSATRARPLDQCRVALVTSAAFHLPSQEPFDESIEGGDASFRAIPKDADLQSLGIAHRSDSFDAAGIEADRNLALPIDRLSEMEKERAIGSLAPRHFSFMGSIPKPEPLIERYAPALAEELVRDEVDVALLTPV